jgi:hypothetical protein
VTYLYLYEGADRRLYIGIGDDMTRPWEAHNEDAQALLAEPTTQVMQTPEPFSCREDARTAEAIAIHIAALAGMQVLSQRGDAGEIVAQATNRAGVKSTRHLVPAVMRKEGTVHYGSLERTAVVVLRPGEIDERGSLHGGRDVATFVSRSGKTWPLQTARSVGYGPRRLLAIMKTSHVIVGDWDLGTETPVLDDRFVLDDPAEDDPRGVKGMWLDLGGARLGDRLTWSSDIHSRIR